MGNKMAKMVTGMLCACMMTATVGCGSNSSGSAAGASNDSYVINEHYTNENVSEIPEDAVNQVMFAYSDSVDVTFSTELSLNEKDGTYVLTKKIETAKVKDESGEEIQNFVGQWEFTGAYTVSETDASEIVLEAPTEAKDNIYYPTVLNYGSIEPQTQDWVSSDENPEIMTRFNKWYPAKNSAIKSQTVKLSDGTMEFINS